MNSIFSRVVRRLSPVRKGVFPVALVGCDGWASNYVSRLARSRFFDLRVCFDRDTEMLHKVCSRTRSRKAESIADALQDPTTRAVFVVLPNHLHKDVILEGLSAGKHIFVEKPVVSQLADLESIREQESRFGVRVFSAQRFRRRNLIRRIRDEVREMAKTGSVNLQACLSHNVRFASDNWRYDDRKCPFGVMEQLGVHLLDLFHWFLGPPVDARLEQLVRDPELGFVEGTFELDYGNDVRASLIASYLKPPTFLIEGQSAEVSFRWNTSDVRDSITIRGETHKILLNDEVQEDLDEFAAFLQGKPNQAVGTQEVYSVLQVLERLVHSWTQ